MTLFRSKPRSVRSRATWVTALGALFALGMVVALVGGAAAAPTAVSLGAADSFAVLAGSGITNTGPTTISGDLGTYPLTSITGASSLTVTGTNHGGDAVTQSAKTDLVTAYNAVAGEGPPSPIVADLAGQTLTAGVYNSASSIGLSGSLTLDAGGNPDAVFVFQAGSTLTTGPGSNVVLIHGAQSCNVYWQVGTSATLGTYSTFRGTILALSSITVTTGVTVDGRVLARNGAVTLDTDTITRSTCSRSRTTTGTTTATTPSTTTTTTTGTTTATTPSTTTTTTTGTTTTTTPTPTTSTTTTTTPTTTTTTTTKKKHTTTKTHTYARPARKHAGLTG